jgi:hypothetical protein
VERTSKRICGPGAAVASASLAALAALAATGPLGCGEDVSVGNVNPRGAVAGLVVDAATGQALSKIKVRLVAAGSHAEPVETDELGFFEFTAVPAGIVLVVIEPAGTYWGATIRGELTGEAGQFSTGNEALTLGPIGLLPADTQLALRVLDERGRPAPNYTFAVSTVVEWVDLAGGEVDAEGRRGFGVTTDASGVAKLPPLPDFWRLGNAVSDQLVLSLPGFDQNQDGILEFAGGVQTLALRTLADPRPDILLDPAYAATLQVVASTLGSLEGGPAQALPAVVSGGEPIHIKFNLPIDAAATAVKVLGEEGAAITQAVAVDVNDELVRIGFTPALPAGAEFNLQLHVVSAVGDRLVDGDFAAPFFSKSAQENVSIVATPMAGVVRVTFGEPVGTGDNNLNFLNGANCVMFFNADINNSGGPPGDVPSEIGNPACDGNIYFRALEPDPPGPVGLSGYTRHWEFPLPPNVGSGTQVQLVLSRVVDQTRRLQRPDGRPVQDFVGSMILTLP